MKRLLEAGSQHQRGCIKRKHFKARRSKSLEEELLHVWHILCKLPVAIKALTLLYLPENYLWMLWHHFPKHPTYEDAYFLQFNINSQYGERVIEEARKGRVFRNMVSLNLPFKSSFTAVVFNKTFPQLRILSLDVSDAQPMLGIEHKTLSILRIRNARSPKLVKVLEIDWHISCPSLRLLENNVSMWGNLVAICQSSGLASVKPVKRTEQMCIVHFDTLTERIATLDISSLPESPNCSVLVLAAKQLRNLEQLLKIRSKFPKISYIRVYTSSIHDRQLISKIREKVGIKLFSVEGMNRLRHDLLDF